MNSSAVLSFLAVGALLAAFPAAAMEPIRPIVAPFAMPVLERPVFPGRVYSIADYGAVAGGSMLNEDAVQRAIDACHAAGGGIVRVPAGRWLTTPIELRSNVNLRLEADAVLAFTHEKKHYFVKDLAEHRWNHSQNSGSFSMDPERILMVPKPLISAFDSENIAITGPGTLDGQGSGWWPLHPRFWANHKHKFPGGTEERAWAGLDRASEPGRPRMVQPVNCRNVLLEGFTAINGPFWKINPVACENVIIRRLTVHSPESPNTDGINPESCRNVLIEYCDIKTGDDSIAIKSGLDEAGWARGRPSENIVIRNVRAVRFAMGSEMSGGVRNILIRDCDLTAGPGGISIKTRRGRGSVVENIWVENVDTGLTSMASLRVEMQYWTQHEPAPPEPVTERTPRIRNIHYRNVRTMNPASAGMTIYLNGLPEAPLENVVFENIHGVSKRGIVASHVRNVVFRNVSLQPSPGPAIDFLDIRDATFTDLALPPDVTPFMRLRGAESGDIRFDATWSFMKDHIQYEQEAKQSAVRFGP